MLKKRNAWKIVCFTGLLLTAFPIVADISSSAKPSSEYCVFCDQKILDYQKFYEDDLVLGLCTHKPIEPGHCLIIPKRHVARFEQLSDEEITAMGHLIKKVDRAVSKAFGTSAYMLLQKNGAEVGQTVFHVHFHYIPRKADEKVGVQFLMKFFLEAFKSPVSEDEMHENVQKMIEAMKDTSSQS